MSLYDKVLPNNKPEQFKDIEEKINKASNLPDTIAKYREEIMDILKNNEAHLDDKDNEKKTLFGLITELEKKKSDLQTDLGKTPPCKIDLSDDTDIINFWKSIVDGSNPKILGKSQGSEAATESQKNDINDKIMKALKNLQFVHNDGKGNLEKTFKLFEGAATDPSKTKQALGKPKTLISQLLYEKDGTKIDKLVKLFVNTVKSSKGNTGGGNPFFISKTKLDDDVNERKVAIRIALFLYCIYRIANPDKSDPNGSKHEPDILSKNLYNDINEKLDQLINNEIPKIKGIHNAKVELGYLKPEYDTLEKLSLKSGDIDGGTHNLSTTPLSIPPINLTSEFETGAPITKNIDEYRVIENKVNITDAGGTNYKASFVDGMGNTGDLFAKLASKTTSVDFCIKVGGNKIKIGKLTLCNTPGNAELKINIDDEATINAAFTTAGVTIPKGPFKFEIPIKGIKNVSNKLKGCKASLTKPCKITITTGDTGSTPPTTPTSTAPADTFNVEASISNVTEVSREEAERVAEEELRERFENLPWYNPDKINLFFRRDYIKEKRVRKIMNEEKGLSRKDRDTNATNRQQIQSSQDKIFDDEIQTIDIETKCPNTYHEIDKLCKNYIGIPPDYHSSITDDQFKNDFYNKIINHDPPLDKPSILECIGKERSLTYSSNILFRMNMFIAHQKMANNILNYLNETPPHSDTDIQTYCRGEIKKYMDVYNDLPKFLESTGTKLDDPNFVTTLKLSTGTLTNIVAQTMKLKMNIIKKGSAAYKIKQKRGRIVNTGNLLDNRKKQMPLWLLETLGWTSGIARTGIIMGAGFTGGMLFGPAGTAFATGSAVGLNTLFSKFSHYTKEHEGQMKNEAVDLANYEAERSRLQTAVSGKKWYQTKRLWGDDRKDLKHRNKYVRTTHGVSEHTTTLTNNISTLANKNTTLSTTEIQQLKDFVSEGFARLTYYKETGQNFLGSDDVNKAEEDYKNLYTNLISGAKRLGWIDIRNPNKLDEGTITSYSNYKTTLNSLKIGYETAKKRFRKKRRKLGLGGAAVTGFVSGGMSYLSTQMWGKIIGKGDEHNFITPGDENSALPMTNIENGGGSRSLHDIFKDAMSSKPHASGYELYVSPEIDQIPTGASTGHTYSSLTAKIASIRATIPSTDTKTLEIFDKAMQLHNTMPPWYKRSALERAIAYACDNGADVGNQYLFGERFAETVKNTITARASAGTNNIPIDRIRFWKPSANANISTIGSTGNISERSMNGILRIRGGNGVGIPTISNTFKRHEGNVKPKPTT